VKAILSKYVLFLFLLAAGFLTLAAGVCYRAARVLQENQRRVTDTYEVLGHMEALKGAMWLAERDERNYVITEEGKWLAGYDEARGQIDDELGRIGRITADSPGQQRRLAELRPVVAARMKSLDDAIVAFRRGGIEAARPRIVNGDGPREMVRAVGMLDGMRRAEERLLASRQVQSARGLRNLLLTFVLVAVMSAGLLGTIFLGVRREARARAEGARQLKESEGRLLLAVEAAGLGIWEHDLGTGRIISTERCERMLGLPAAGGPVTMGVLAERIHPEDREHFAEVVRRATEPGGRGEFVVEYRVVWPDGAVRWIRGRGRVVYEGEGAVRRAVRVVGTIMDITDVRRAEADLREARDRAEAASHTKDLFLAALSHELRTPLTPVLATVSEMEGREDVPAGVRGELATVRRNVEMEARLIDDLLDMTRVARGELQLHPEVVDVHGLVGSVLGMFRGQAAEKGLRVMTELSAGAHHAWGDPGRLQQVLWNLVSNAVKFTPVGGEVWVRTMNDGAGRLMVEVVDTGIGIEPEVLPRLFNAFEQGERTIARRYGGLGLGLSISKAITELHGGVLEVRSEGRGRGTAFCVRLPAVEAPLPAAVVEVKGPAAAATPSSRGAGGKLRVLLVEDNEDTRRLMGRLLRSFGHHVEAADCVAAALELAGRERFDLLVSDIGLPDGTGWDLMGRLGERRPARAIAISGFGMEEDVRRSKEAGFAEHVTKPVNVAALREVIERVAAADGARRGEA
jgi:PAS domain S-box-containing protein